jgi:molybdate transport system substrate-binding protein
MRQESMSNSRIAARGLVLAAALCAFGITLGATVAQAADIKVLASGALKLVLPQLLTDFQKSSGHAASVAYGPAGAIANRVRRGDAADVAIVTKSQLEGLQREGKIIAGTGTDIAGTALGVAIRKGAAKPDIGTAETFKQALLSASAIGYRDPATGSTSGIYTARMLDQLGIAQLLRSKIKLDSSEGAHPEDVFQSLLTGETELQIGQISEIVLAPGVELVGPLPAEIQDVTMLAAAVTTNSTAPDAARALIAFLSSASTAAILQASGFQPATRN